jgi:hypothetical protein
MASNTELLQKRMFFLLVRENRDLAEVRRQYAAMPVQERREAADWQYQSAMANGRN